MYQRLDLLRIYLNQPRVPSYALAEVAIIARALESDYGFGLVAGQRLSELVKAGQKVEALELVGEIQWLMCGGDVVREKTDLVSEVPPTPEWEQCPSVEDILALPAKSCAQVVAKIDDRALLDDLERAERTGKQRKTVFDAIGFRREVLI